MWIDPSSVSAQESVASISASSMDLEQWAKMLEPCAWWRGKSQRWQSWRRKCKPGTYLDALSGLAILKPSQPNPCEEWISLHLDTLANHSPMRAKEKGLRTNATFGQPSKESFPMCNLLGCSLKTSLDMSRWGCGRSCQIWKDLVSDARGACSERSKLARHIDESGSSSSAWPTPTTQEVEHPSAEICPKTGRRISKDGGSTHSLGLADQVGNAENNAPTNGPLDRAVPRDPTSPLGQLNADWVEILMGYQVGWTDCGPSEMR